MVIHKALNRYSLIKFPCLKDNKIPKTHSKNYTKLIKNNDQVLNIITEN
jgi:hypothetical protein